MAYALESTSRREILMMGAGIAALAATWRFSGGVARAAAPVPLKLSDAAWKKRLLPKAYAVLRQSDTEQPFTSPLLKEHRKGVFLCGGCMLPIFSSTTKFDSGTGWPSFYDHLPDAIAKREDDSIGTERTEVRCARCDGHLGHVFDDGPKPTGLRYCMNGVALKFQAA